MIPEEFNIPNTAAEFQSIIQSLGQIRELPSLSQKHHALLDLLQDHDPTTFRHSNDVRETTSQLCHYLKIVSPRLLVAADLHDAGKLVVPQYILHRTNNEVLNPITSQLLTTHPQYSAGILQYLGFPSDVVDLAAYHDADYKQIAHLTYLYHGNIFLPSLLRLADSLTAAMDLTRKYQGRRALVPILFSLRDKHNDIQIQKLVEPAFFWFTKQELFFNWANQVPLT